MSKPQQPELARSGYSETDPASAKRRTGGPTDATGTVGAVPEDNLPGHHPDQDQDKPEGPPPRPRARRAATATATTKAATATATKDGARAAESVDGPATATITDLGQARADQRRARFRFEFEPRVGPFSYALGITPWTTGVEVADGKLKARFGAWSLCTDLDNIEGAEVTGPYTWVKVAGPPHLSLRDRGLTFATSTRSGVCIRFRQPVPGLFPAAAAPLRHTALTVTVEDAEALAELLNQ